MIVGIVGSWVLATQMTGIQSGVSKVRFKGTEKLKEGKSVNNWSALSSRLCAEMIDHGQSFNETQYQSIRGETIQNQVLRLLETPTHP